MSFCFLFLRRLLNVKRKAETVTRNNKGEHLHIDLESAPEAVMECDSNTTTTAKRSRIEETGQTLYKTNVSCMLILGRARL